MKKGVLLVIMISIVLFFSSMAEEKPMENSDMNSIIGVLRKDNIEYYLHPFFPVI